MCDKGGRGSFSGQICLTSFMIGPKQGETKVSTPQHHLSDVIYECPRLGFCFNLQLYQNINQAL